MYAISMAADLVWFSAIALSMALGVFLAIRNLKYSMVRSLVVLTASGFIVVSLVFLFQIHSIYLPNPELHTGLMQFVTNSLAANVESVYFLVFNALFLAGFSWFLSKCDDDFLGSKTPKV